MRLSYEQICQITRGTARIKQTEEGFHFLRFTRSQEEYYQRTNQDFYNKSFATAGVRLSFTTDASLMRIAYRMKKASSRNFGWFDVYENGVLTDHFGGDTAEPLEDTHETLLSQGEKRVDVYFPWSAAAEIGFLELTDGAWIRPLPAKCTMLAFGDSITQGYDAVFPSMSYQCQMAAALEANCLNKGIGAERFCPGLLTQREEICPDLITVAYGTNDWSGRDRATFAENCRGFFTTLCDQYPGTPVYMITPIWRADSTKQTPFAAPLSEAVSLLEEICGEFPAITVIRGDDFTPRIGDFYSDRYLHPNDLGFAWYGSSLVKALSREMEI